MFKRFSSGSLGLCFSVTVLLLAGCGGGSSGGGGGGFTSGVTKAELGRKIFVDTDLSSSRNQSCASCHDLSAPDLNGFADPDVTKTAPVSEGSEEDVGAFGNRNAPTAGYASFSPVFGLVADPEQTGETDSKYRGGQFLDGRAATLVEQAKGPFSNPVEMNIAESVVVARVAISDYANDFRTIYGSGAFDNTATAFNNIADAIAAFEKTAELNPFTSKYDAYLLDQYTFTAAEQRGLDLFKDATTGGAKCANCHTLDDTIGSSSKDSLFTNFEYYNVGTPSNTVAVPSLSTTDEGLGSGDNEAVDIADLAAERGKFKVPTLRNVALTAPYMHNGVYDTLEEVIRHYDIFGGESIEAEVAGNIANELLDPINQQGLGLDSALVTVPEFNDYDALEAFMLTLSDGYL